MRSKFFKLINEWINNDYGSPPLIIVFQDFAVFPFRVTTDIATRAAHRWTKTVCTYVSYITIIGITGAKQRIKIP